MIEIKNLTKCYDKKCILKNINLKINDNEQVSIIGKSGCDKIKISRLFGKTIVWIMTHLDSTSTPSFDFGKSRICPIEAITLVLPPINLVIVLAFAGDSTIINLFAITFSFFLFVLVYIKFFICQIFIHVILF